MRKRQSTDRQSPAARVGGVSELKTLPDSGHYACPECGGQELRMAVLLTGVVTFRFSAEDGEKEMVNAGEFASDTPSAGRCECVNCGWIGVSAEAAVDSTGRLTWRLADVSCD